MSVFAIVPIDKIKPHPNNVRRNAVADDELIDSVRASGILEPVVLGPEDESGVRPLVMGNRRFDAAIKAELTALPAILRDDLVTVAQQIEVMLQENLHRKDITAVEEADAYEQLTLEGLDVDAIAAATGRSVKTVKARRRLVGLTAGASEALHAGQITLGDAEILLQFADDPDAVAELEKEIGTSNFEWKARDIKHRRERAVKHSEAVAGYLEQGAVKADSTGGIKGLQLFADQDLRDPAAHATGECLGYTDFGPESYAAPQLVCMNPDSHAEQEDQFRDARREVQDGDREKRQAEWEAQQAAREERRAADQAAMETRVAWLRGFFADQCLGRQKPSVLGKAARAVLPMVVASPNVLEIADYPILAAAFDIDEPGQMWDGGHEKLQAEADQIQAANPARGLEALAALLAAITVDALMVPPDDEAETRRQLFAWDWLQSAGYPMADPDKAAYATAEETLASYAAAAEDD